jgi:sulfate/thiosulfate transport system substrate-binding protein
MHFWLPSPFRVLAASAALPGALLVSSVLFASAGCGGKDLSSSPTENGGIKPLAARTLTLGAYTTPREAYGKSVIPAFHDYWKQKTGQDVEFEESYLGSGAQSRAIVEGFEADVAALSLEADVDRIAKAGLITKDWKANPSRGMVSQSVVVLGVRPGNPKGIHDWDDLARPDVEVLTPNVKTSGGAMWNVAAVWGAALRGHTHAPAGDPVAAQALLKGIFVNVKIMDKGARESVLTFEKGVGDVAITYENEILVGRAAGQTYDYVVPSSTILIENPIAVVDSYAEKHGNKDLAAAFVAFCLTAESQRTFAQYGLRPVNDAVAAEVAGKFPPVADLFTIRDLGDWSGVGTALFDQGAVYDRVMASLQEK